VTPSSARTSPTATSSAIAASDIRLVDQAARRWQPMTLEAQNVQSNYRTVIRFENFRANQGVNPEYFTTRAMERDE
jgi:outer membrane lipoprotein-sorting protein